MNGEFEIGMISTIANRSIAIVAVIIFAIYILIGTLKGWKKTGVRLAFIGITVLLSMLFTVLLVKAFEPLIENLIVNLVNNANAEASMYLNEATSSSPTLIHYAYSLIFAVVSPVVFVVVFLILSLIMKIPAAKINKLVLRLTEGKLDNPLLNRLGGAFLGLVCAFSVISCLFMPITGYLTVGYDIYETLKSEEIIPDDEAIDEVLTELTEIKEDKFFKYQSTVSKPLFLSVAKVRTEYESKTLSEEVQQFITIYKDVKVVVENDYSDIMNIKVDDINTLVDTATESETYRQIFAEILSSASKKWSNGKDFLGFNLKGKLNSDIHPCIDVILKDFIETNKDEVNSDIKTLTTTFEVLIQMVDSLEGLSFEDTSNFDTTKLNETIDIIDSSQKLEEIIAVLLSTGAEKWSSGEAFIGVDLNENVPLDFQGALRVAFSELETTSQQTICSDLRAFCGAIDVLSELGEQIALMDFNDYKAFNIEALDSIIAKIETDVLVKKVVAEILNDAGDAWGGEPPREFFGVNAKESLPQGFENALDKNIEDFKTTNERTVVSDLQRFSDTVKAYKYAISLSDPEASLDDLQDNMENFVISINQNNVDILKDVITDEMLSVSGVPIENSPIISDLLSSTIQNISGLDDDLKLIEAQTLNNLLAYSKDHQENLGGSTSSSVTEEEMVDSIVNSTAVSQSIRDYAKYSTGIIKSNEEEKNAISSALEKYEGTTDENVSSTVSAIEKLFGLGG